MIVNQLWTPFLLFVAGSALNLMKQNMNVVTGTDSVKMISALTEYGKKVLTMIKENGKIKEISENEVFCMFVDNEYYMAMDFYEFRSRLEEAGAKITKN